MRTCERCGGEVEHSFRYCPWCAAPQRLKLVEFFAAHPSFAADRGRSLRVSRYLGSRESERHVRFSVWSERGETAEATAAVSLDEAAASRLGGFLERSAPAPAPPAGGFRSLVRELRDACLTRR